MVPIFEPHPLDGREVRLQTVGVEEHFAIATAGTLARETLKECGRSGCAFGAVMGREAMRPVATELSDLPKHVADEALSGVWGENLF